MIVVFYGEKRYSHYMHPYARGSEWRKWDLHIHTPASHGYQGSYEDLIKQINNADCDVVGINDYCSIEGYKQLKIGGKVTKPMFPVVEFRMNNTIGHRSGTTQTHLNFHVIFNPDLSVTTIENFIGGTDYINSAGNEDKISNVVGAENLLKVSLDYFTFVESLEANEQLKGNYLIWLPYDEYGGIDGIDPEQSYFKPSLINKAHIIGSGNAKQISFFLWEDEKFSLDDYKSWFPAPMPCIKGSDCHKSTEEVGKLRDEHAQPTDKYCWIKADPTFDGLKQITIEPKDRVFIGEIPPKLVDVESNKSKYIDAISIYPKVSSSSDQWFDDEIPLSSELVAIIGKKGSGKSALADIIALAGRSHASADTYSFLHPTRFWEKKGVPEKYEAKLKWMDGKSKAYHLHEKVVLTEVERVKYLPQKHVEHLCNQFGVGDSFQKEINKIVFSYVEESEKLGSSSLEELIQKKTRAIDKEVTTLRGKLEEKLGDFIFLEKKQDKAYLEGLINKLDEKKRELESIKPPPSVTKPKSDIAPKTKARLEKISDEIAALSKKIEEATTKLATINADLQIVSNIETKLTAFEMNHEELKAEIQPDAEKLGLKTDEMVALKIDRKSLGVKKRSFNQEKEKLSALIDPKDEKSLTAQEAALSKELSEITSKLDQKNKDYQKYQQSLKAYKARIATLTGKDDDTTLETIASIEKEIEYVSKKLEADLKKAHEEIMNTSAEIFTKISSKKKVYGEIYSGLKESVDAQKDRQQESKNILDFDVNISFAEQSFIENFLTFIHKGKVGLFKGEIEGRERIVDLIKQYDLRKKSLKIDDVLHFLDAVLNDMNAKTQRDKGVTVEMQLKEGLTRDDLYEFLLQMSYLDVQYKVTFNGKDLNEDKFSSGEKGALLLIFYLLIDKGKIPLVIDQPEENLDNESVFELLVPYIKQAKRDRQIIIVTHNPNLAIVCDAEQIIHATMDKKINAIRYESGSIEHLPINNKAADILEGTLGAFVVRDGKYIRRKLT